MRNRTTLLAFFGALSLLSVWFLWPLYQDAYLFITVTTGLAAGFFIARWQNKKSIGAIGVLIAVAITYLVLALPVANPRALSNPAQLLLNILETIQAPAIAWKQLVTIELPVGTYHALLAPAFLAYLIAGLVMGWVFFGPIKRYWSVAYAFLGLVVLAISFGATTVQGDFNLLGIYLPIATPLVSGSLLFLLLVIYLNWGARTSRSLNLNQKIELKSTSVSFWQRKAKKSLSTIAVLAVAIGGTGLFMLQGGIPATRTVLRTDVTHLDHIAKQASPLSTYRMYFNNPTLLNGTILSYSTEGAPDRIRIATMPYYDGANFTVAPSAGADSAGSFLFARVPSELPSTSDGKIQKLKLNLGLLDSLWLPLVSGVRKIDFAGPNSSVLADSLFVNRATATGAIVPGRSNNAEYEVTYNTVTKPDPEGIESSSASINENLIPDSLQTWLDNQTDLPGSNGSGIEALAKRLRERGYLSHSFVAPVAAETGEVWSDLLTNYSFSQSNAGHNLSRIDLMFNDINSREQSTSNKKSLVATAGDDEQFATAIALIAAAKGFPSRVVVGFRTNKLEGLPGVDTCTATGNAGICKGQNLSAWTEIQGSNGEWLAIDATPQFVKKINQKPSGTAYTPNPTGAGEDAASQLPPAKASPSSDAYCQTHKNDPTCSTPECLWGLCSIFSNYILPALEVALVVSVFTGPFAVIILMKRNRRKGRRNHKLPETRVVGAWEEYVDLLVDSGAELPRSQTRRELAVLYKEENLVELADLADIASFSPRMPTPTEIDLAWDIFDEKRESVIASASKWNRIKMELSLRSFVRYVNPKAQMQKLKTTFSFVQGSNQSRGSSSMALLVELRRQIVALFSKK